VALPRIRLDAAADRSAHPGAPVERPDAAHRELRQEEPRRSRLNPVEELAREKDRARDSPAWAGAGLKALVRAEASQQRE
jgi:hypothetical protein